MRKITPGSGSNANHSHLEVVFDYILARINLIPASYKFHYPTYLLADTPSNPE